MGFPRRGFQAYFSFFRTNPALEYSRVCNVISTQWGWKNLHKITLPSDEAVKLSFGSPKGSSSSEFYPPHCGSQNPHSDATRKVRASSVGPRPCVVFRSDQVGRFPPRRHRSCVPGLTNVYRLALGVSVVNGQHASMTIRNSHLTDNCEEIHIGLTVHRCPTMPHPSPLSEDENKIPSTQLPLAFAHTSHSGISEW